MRSLKRVGIIIVVGVLLILLANSFVVISITDRAIILGIGVDYFDENYQIICEVIAPNGTQDTSSTKISQMVEGKGKTISLAVYDIYQRTGKLPSLGQCSVILLGKSLYGEHSLEQCLAYFSFSDAFKDGTIVACAEGEAREVFKSTTPLDNSVSFALQTVIQSSHDNTAIPQNNLSNFVAKQLKVAKSSFLNLVKVDYTDAPKSDKSSTEPLAIFDASGIAVFKNNRYVDTLSKDAKQGFTLAIAPKAFDTFVVEDNEGKSVLPDRVGVGITTKKISTEVTLENGKASLEIKINATLRRMKTDTTGNVVDYLPVSKSEITDYMAEQVKEQMTQKITKALEQSRELDCDFLLIANSFYNKYSTEWLVYEQSHPKYLNDLTTKINIEINK